MHVFDLRNHLIEEYTSYISSFIQIKDAEIRSYVDQQLANGLLWPDPLIQLNPSFAPGKKIDTLVQDGILHRDCGNIFRIKENEMDFGSEMRLHKHQEQAVRIAAGKHNYVLTTGTGSGKSLAYIIPIVDHVVRRGSGKGVQAIIVYPMNALANSQLGELEKFIQFGFSKGKHPVTFARYTGQENDVEKNAIMANPPDILLTNYVMLELILTRPGERKTLVRAAQNMRFLVLDELHTYRGRQGSDVAMLVRRVRDILNARELQCVGTSATLAGGGNLEDQQAEVAKVASLMFGAEVKPEHVIGETLQRATPEFQVDEAQFRQRLRERVLSGKKPASAYADFVADHLSSWIETTFGVAKEHGSARLIRATPISISGQDGAAQRLSQLVNVSYALWLVSLVIRHLGKRWENRDPLSKATGVSQ